MPIPGNAFIPNEAFRAVTIMIKAQEYAANDRSIIKRHLGTKVCAVALIVISALNTPRFFLSGLLEFSSHVVKMDLKDAVRSLGKTWLDGARSGAAVIVFSVALLVSLLWPKIFTHFSKPEKAKTQEEIEQKRQQQCDAEEKAEKDKLETALATKKAAQAQEEAKLRGAQASQLKVLTDEHQRRREELGRALNQKREEVASAQSHYHYECTKHVDRQESEVAKIRKEENEAVKNIEHSLDVAQTRLAHRAGEVRRSLAAARINKDQRIADQERTYSAEQAALTRANRERIEHLRREQERETREAIAPLLS